MTNFISRGRSFAAIAGLAILGACTTPAENTAGVRTIDIDPATRGPVAGVGVEGQDIVSMTDQMMREMLTTPVLANAMNPPRVIIDSEYFVNEGSQPINKNLITNRLRVALNQAARGRMSFIGRQYSGMVAEERALKRSGTVDTATRGLTRAQAGGDYRLGGSMATLDSRDGSGMIQRYTQITFEMIDLETGEIVWTGLYEMGRAAADDVVYR